MPPPFTPDQIVKAVPALLSDMQHLFGAMDQEFEKISSALGFKCTGCADNCCRSLFYHHTVAEWVYLQIGIAHLSQEQQLAMRMRAQEVNQRMLRPEIPAPTYKVMCAANVEGLCVIYPYRPMICRMHGIPNILSLPNGNCIEGPGCDAFTNRPTLKAGAPMDRTSFYQRLAMIEKAVRSTIGYTKKIKKTVSEMIVDASLP